MFISCQGPSCTNVESNATDEDSFEVDEDLPDISLLEQLTQIEQKESKGVEEEMSDHVEFDDE